MDLPVEVRLMIYRFHLVHWRGYIPIDHEGQTRDDQAVKSKLGVNILLAYRIVYDEAIGILYGENNFCISQSYNHLTRCLCLTCNYCLRPYKDSFRSTQVMERMGKANRERIRKVEILLNPPDDMSIHHYQSMVSWLPKLQSRVFYFDCTPSSVDEPRDPITCARHL